jgi:hypothetical protein
MKRRHQLVFAVLAIGLSGIGSGLIRAQTSTVDYLARLTRALADAGAPALTSTQEQQLNALITAARSNRQGREPSAEVQAARTAYDNALLAGDVNTAAAQAAIIANATAAHMRTRLEADANFVVQAMNVLRSNGDQIGLLQKSIGNAGLLRLMSSLAGGPGGGFRGGPGPRGPRQPGFRQ